MGYRWKGWIHTGTVGWEHQNPAVWRQLHDVQRRRCHTWELQRWPCATAVIHKFLLTCKSGIILTLWVIMAIKWECVETSRTALHNGDNHCNNNKRRTVSMYLSVDSARNDTKHSKTPSHLILPVFLRGSFHSCFISRETGIESLSNFSGYSQDTTLCTRES